MGVVLFGLLAASVTGQSAQGHSSVSPTASPGTQTDVDTTVYVWRVYLRNDADLLTLTSGDWDVLESRGADYLLIMGDDATAAALRAQGFRVEVDEVIPAVSLRSPLTYYGGYHTVAEHEQHLSNVVSAHPDLAQRLDYGDSWRKQRGLANGHDLYAICITRLRPGDCTPGTHNDKARYVLVTGVHARELVPPELAWRWIDELVNGYATDPDITALLEYTEMWVVPLVNPDGRHIVEQGGSSPYYQRKNANNLLGSCSNPPTSSNHYGIDLNRNADFHWYGSGASTAPCSPVYKGTAPNSEPETVAFEALMSSLFVDQWDPALTSAAPLTTTGIMLNIHSTGNMAMIPWDWTSQDPPNNAELRSIVFRMSYFNGYTTGSSGQILYISSGTLDDWAYGTLGIPNIVFEVGSVFMPSYSLVDSTYYPLNRGALRYAAKIARQPYILSYGPSTLTPSLTLTTTYAGTAVTLTAWLDDQPYGTVGTGRPAIQAISAAEYYVDTPPWARGTPIAMQPVDGTFNSSREQATALVDTVLCPGRHTLFIRGRDTSGSWGPTTATWLFVTPAPSRVLSGTVVDRIDNTPLGASVFITGSVPGTETVSLATTDPATGIYSLTLSGELTYTMTALAPDYIAQTHLLTCDIWTNSVDFALLPATFHYGAALPFVTFTHDITSTADLTATPWPSAAP